MKLTRIIAAAAAPLALGGALLGTTAASADTVASSPAVSAYYWQPNGNALGGPQPVSGGYVPFGSSYLAKVTEKMNNANINGQVITITGHLDQGTLVTDQPNGGDSSTGPGAPSARVYFIGTGGSDGSPTQLGLYSQSWWANGTATVYLNSQGTQEFTLTIPVSSTAGWSDWDGQNAASNATDATLFAKAASHVRELGLSFGGGWFFENGVNGQGGLTVDSIQVSPAS
jgi:hypothetical protein